ncbi:MAG: YceI family protein [Gammaproteobacteria bacterium]
MRKLVFTFLLFTTQIAAADWQLNNSASSLNFISTKNSAITEIHSFKTLSGQVKDNGEAKLSIYLDSVESKIPIRNERMRQFLFETDRFKIATVALKIDPNTLVKLRPGDRTEVPLMAQLNLHGESQDIEAHLRVVKLQNNSLVVSTIEPIILLPSVFELQLGLDKLKEIAKLSTITTSIPVTFSLVFDLQ